MSLKDFVGRAYAGAFARERMQPVNHALYHLALRGMGYNNGWQPGLSGEEWFVREVLAPARPTTCFDVGANVGVYSRLLLEHTGANVVAFEPLPDAFQRLVAIREATAANTARFSVFNNAVGSSSGVEVLHYGDPLTEHASLAVSASEIDYVGAGNTRTMSVQVITLDEFMTSEQGLATLAGAGPDFIKIDVEGYEYEVLLGAQETIATHRPGFIQIEWNLHQLTSGTTFLSMCKLLPGYVPYQLLPHGMRRVDPMTPDANTFCYANFVFVLDRATSAANRATSAARNGPTGSHEQVRNLFMRARGRVHRVQG